MESTVYTICAVAGGALVVLQVVLQAFGLFGETDLDAPDADVEIDADGDVPADADAEPHGHGNLFFGILSFKALCAFAAIFGLVGLILLERESSFGLRVAVSILSGAAGMVVVAMLMRGLARLSSSGTLQLRNAVGKTATVYLRIPAGGAASGKVTVEIQGRSVEILARTAGGEIPTGARVRVVGVDGEDTVEVTAI